MALRQFNLLAFTAIMLVCNCFGTLNAQVSEGLIVCAEDGTPLPGASAYDANLSKSAVADSSGFIALSAFPDSDLITISFLGYESFQGSLASIDFDTLFLKEITFFYDEFEIIGSKPNAYPTFCDVVRIESNSLGQIQSQSSADLLEKSGQVFVQRSQLGGGSPILRGFEASRIMLLVDGVKMNNAIYRSGHLQNSITLNRAAIDRVEVIHGPASLLYGSDALGGAIHFHTKSPKLASKEERITINGAISSALNSVNQGISLSSSTTIAGKRWASISILSANQFGDLRAGRKGIADAPSNWKRSSYQDFVNGTDTLINRSADEHHIQLGSAYNQFDILQKFYFKPNNQMDIWLNMQYSTSSNIPRYDQLNEFNQGSPNFARWDYGPQVRGLASLKMQYKTAHKLFDQSRINLAVQQIEESRIVRRFNAGDETTNTENLLVYSLNAVFQKNWKQKTRKQLFYGVDGQFNDLDSGGSIQNIFGQTPAPFLSRYPSGTAQNMQAGLFTTFQISNLTETSSLHLGIRGNLHQSNLSFENNAGIIWPSSYTDGSLQIKNQSLVGSIAYQKQLSKAFQTTLSVSNAYRAPNIDDLAKIRVKGDFVNIPNPNIKPERTTAIEWGVNYTGTNTEIKHQVFYNIVNDLLVRRISDQIVVDGFTSLINENTTQGFIAGSSAYLHQNLGKQLSLDVNYSYTLGRTFFQQSNPEMDTVVAMGHIPPFFGSAALTWANQALEMKLSWRFNGRKSLRDYEVVDIITEANGEQVIIRAGSSDNLEFGNVFESASRLVFQDLPAWQVFDLHWLYKQENRTFFLSIENLLDQHYRTFSSGISAPGRNFNLGIIINY